MTVKQSEKVEQLVKEEDYEKALPIAQDILKKYKSTTGTTWNQMLCHLQSAYETVVDSQVDDSIAMDLIRTLEELVRDGETRTFQNQMVDGGRKHSRSGQWAAQVLSDTSVHLERSAVSYTTSLVPSTRMDM